MALAVNSGFGNRLRLLRVSHQMSQSQLAKAIGRHQTAIGPYERGEYMPARDIVERIAHVLGSSPEYLLFGRSPYRSQIEIAGGLGVHGILQPVDSVKSGTSVAIDDGGLVAYSVLDNAMSPAFDTGDFALVKRAEVSNPTNLVGRIVLAALSDGRETLRQLWPGSQPERHHLVAFAAPDWMDITVVRVREVVGNLRPNALARRQLEQ